MRCSILLFLILFCWVSQTNGQDYVKKQNYIWTFNNYMRLDFNGAATVASPTSSQTSLFATATVCDDNGNLLFYTDGDNFFDRNNNMMPDGYDVSGLAYYIFGWLTSPTTNSMHGAQIVPMPGNKDQYYVFATMAAIPLDGPPPSTARVRYSIVDMSLNGGLGDVVTSKKAVVLDTGSGCPLAAIAGNDCNFWLVTHAADSGIFKVYNITASGIDTIPVISQSIDIIGDDPVVIAASNNRLKIAFGSDYDTKIYDFDPSTAILSNGLSLGFGCSDATFSPDDTKFYMHGDESGYIYQFDLSSSTPTAFVEVSPVIAQNGLRLGPDGKIYTPGVLTYTAGVFSSADLFYICHIDHPNVAGTACQFNSTDSLPITGGYMLGFFPNPVPVLITDTAVTRQRDYLCYQGAKQLQASDTTGTGYLWQDSVAGSTRTTGTPGVYIVTYKTFAPCTYHSDTINVTAVGDITPNLGPDTLICDSNTYLLSASVPNVNYRWSDGSSDSTDAIAHTGTYSVQVSRNGCTASDTVSVQFINLLQNIGNDTAVCLTAPVQVQLNANVPAGATALWSNGSSLSTTTVTDTGAYWITVSYPPSCVGTDTIHIYSQLCNCLVEMPNAFTPNDDGKDDVFRPVIQPGCPATGYVLTIYNRWGQVVFTSNTAGQGWDGTQHGMPAGIGTYMYDMEIYVGTEDHKYYQHGEVELIR